MGAVLLGVLGLLSYMAFSGRAPCSSVNKAPCGVEVIFSNQIFLSIFLEIIQFELYGTTYNWIDC